MSDSTQVPERDETPAVPTEECDLIMKGGIASGVVYGSAIEVLARRYRFRSIAGTSAGAIAAVVTAAAEYRRRTAVASGVGDPWDGFKELKARNRGLAEGIEHLFEPEPRYRKLLAGLVATTKAPPGSGFFRKFALFLRSFFSVVEIMLALVLLFAAAFAFRFNADAWGVVGLLAAVFAPLIVAFIRFSYLMLTINRTDYGMCTGLGSPGLTNWIHEAVQAVAGKKENEGPLTMRELWGDCVERGCKPEPGVNLVSMTTDLSSSRPYRTPLGVDRRDPMPLSGARHYFTKYEMERLFPAKIVDHLIEMSAKIEAPWTPVPPKLEGWRRREIERWDKLTLHVMPDVEDFPVAISARLSLSFPLLFQTVPLWREDAGWRKDAPPDVSDDETLVAERNGKRLVVRRCLLSDGGISSNFPIHFFDSFLPKRPTFGIMLTEWSVDHDGPVDDDHERPPSDDPAKAALRDPARRSEIYVIDDATHREHGAPPHDEIRVRPITGLLSFIMRIVDTAKDWRDQSQSRLAGNADRIVTIKLTGREGGYNLAMPKPTLDFMNEVGAKAGEKLVDAFEDGARFDDHRFMRALSFLQEIKQRSLEMEEALAAPAPKPGGATYPELLRSYELAACDEVPPPYFTNDAAWREAVATYVERLAELGANAPPFWEKDPMTPPGAKMKHLEQHASLRVTAEAQVATWPRWK